MDGPYSGNQQTMNYCSSFHLTDTVLPYCYRRQLCGLPPQEFTCDNGQAIDELFRLSLQLLERAS